MVDIPDNGNRDGLWNVSVQAVEREEICFAPNTVWQVQAQGFRVYFNTDRPMDLHAHDQIMITAGEEDTSSWAAFIGTVVECGTDGILLYTNPQYESCLMDIRKLERKFSPLISIIGARKVIDRFGFFPPVHYDEITEVREETSKQQDAQKDLSVTIQHVSAGKLEHPLEFFFEDIEYNHLSPAEECNVCLQLSFAYDGGRIRVELDAVTGFAASFLCRKIIVRLHDVH